VHSYLWTVLCSVKQLIYTFSLIMVLLASLLGMWWWQSYKHDREALRERVERDLDDLLVSNVFRKAVPLFMRNGPVWEGGSSREKALRADAYIEYSVSALKAHTTIITEDVHGPDDRFPKIITVRANPFQTDSQSLSFHFQDDGFTLDKLPVELIDTLRRRYGVGLSPVSYATIISGNAQKSFRVKTDLINKGFGKEPSYFEVTDYTGSLLLGLLPEFFFGFLLLGATGFAFASAYRSLFEQEKQLRQKDALVANVAHELKTPIATVGVALEALNMFGADEDPTRRRAYLAIGQAELKRLDQMADRAIDSLQAGELNQRLQPIRTDLSEAVREAWRGLSLRYQLDDDCLQLSTHGNTQTLVDPHYWHHLVYNLLDNACKYGGQPPLIEVAVSSQVNETVLTISDNGPGIPAYEREHIFERFYRIQRPGEGHSVKGHGLGLTFVRQVAKAHGGTVEVDNTADGGARFTVKVPGN
jgi:signal transduction histidine kinase